MADKSSKDNFIQMLKIILGTLLSVITVISIAFASFGYDVVMDDIIELKESKADAGEINQRLINIESTLIRIEKSGEKMGIALQEHIHGPG